MATSDTTLPELLALARDGSEVAAWEIVTKYGKYITKIVRRQISVELRRNLDSEDFAQAVWISFFANTELLGGINDERHMLGVLASLTRHKIVDEYRKANTLKHRGSYSGCSIDEHAGRDAHALQGSDPTPSHVAMAKERWNQIVQKFSATDRKLLQWRIDGSSNEQIARSLGITERGVEKRFQRLRRQIA